MIPSFHQYQTISLKYHQDFKIVCTKAAEEVLFKSTSAHEMVFRVHIDCVSL